MASGPVIAPLPWLELEPGCRIVLEAISAADGSTVADVVITDATIYARAVDLDSGEDDTRLPEWLQEQLV